MNINKPTIGILATPYISQNFKHKYIFIKDNFLKLLKKNDIDSIIIPYNLSKKHLKEIIKSLDGLLIPGSQLGNFYYSKEFKDHFMTQQYLTKLIKNINKVERVFPILGICHGYENQVLIENCRQVTNKNISKMFITVNADNAYRTIPKFTKYGKKMRDLYKKTRKQKRMIHNNSLAISQKKLAKSKKIDIIALSCDKNNVEFIDIIKHKKYPFYGFQGHPERNNPELLVPFFDDVKTRFNKKTKSHKTQPKISKKTVKCKNYGLAKKSSKSKCNFYKI